MAKSKPPTAAPSTPAADGGTSASATADENQNLAVLEWGDGENAGKVRAAGQESWRDPTEAERASRFGVTLEWGQIPKDIAEGRAGKVRTVQLKDDGSGEFIVGDWRDPSLEELAGRPAAPAEPPVQPAAESRVDQDTPPEQVGLRPGVSAQTSLGLFIGLIKRQNAELLRITGHLPTPELRAVEQALGDFALAAGDPELSLYIGAVREEIARTGKAFDAEAEWDEYFSLGLSPAEAIAEEEAEVQSLRR